MENQHRKIHGYRELCQEEIDLMNEIKTLGPVIEGVIGKVQTRIAVLRAAATSESNADEAYRMDDATPERFAALAKTDFQTALMYLTRAVAQPTFF